MPRLVLAGYGRSATQKEEGRDSPRSLAARSGAILGHLRGLLERRAKGWRRLVFVGFSGMLVFGMPTPKAKLNPSWLSIAVRTGQETVEIPADMIELRIVTCGKCGATYTIRHSRPYQRPELAQKHVEDINRKLLTDHERGTQHMDVYWIVDKP